MSAILLDKKKKICCVLSPLLFIYAKLTNLFVINIGEIDASELLRPLLILNVIYFFCFYFLYLFSNKSLIRAALYSFILIITQFMVNDFEYLVIHFLGEIKIVFRVVIYIIISLIPLFILKRMRNVNYEYVKLVFTSGMSLFLIALYPLTGFINTFKKSSERHAGVGDKVNKENNYYVIVLDAYARSDKLASVYGYDNSGFLEKLRNKDFFISANSMSNHERTMYSLPSFFNMEYIENLGSPSFTPIYSSLWSKEVVNNSKFFKIMRRVGYKILTINTGVTFTHVDDSEILYSPFYKNNNIGNVILYPHITDMEYAVFSHTLLTLYFKYHSSFENKVIRRADMRNGLKALRASVDIKGPKVVFAHFLCPHHPFVFDENGKDVDSADNLVDNSNRLNVKAYAAQARFISSEIEIFINDLVSKDPNCIVVIVGDHGGRAMIDYDDIEKTDLEDAFANLIAIRLPGLNISNSYDDLTLVNVFRMIFREKYHEDIPLLENRQIFNFKANSKPNDVTDRIKAKASARE